MEAGDLLRHLAEEIPFGELVDVPPLDPTDPVSPGMNFQYESRIKDTNMEFNPETSSLMQVKVTDTRESRGADPQSSMLSTPDL
ncbi:MAG: hypothetical protein AB1497_09015 [Bacillota bacterium]